MIQKLLRATLAAAALASPLCAGGPERKLEPLDEIMCHEWGLDSVEERQDLYVQACNAGHPHALIIACFKDAGLQLPEKYVRHNLESVLANCLQKAPATDVLYLARQVIVPKEYCIEYTQHSLSCGRITDASMMMEHIADKYGFDSLTGAQKWSWYDALMRNLDRRPVEEQSRMALVAVKLEEEPAKTSLRLRHSRAWEDKDFCRIVALSEATGKQASDAKALRDIAKADSNAFLQICDAYSKAAPDLLACYARIYFEEGDMRRAYIVFMRAREYEPQVAYAYLNIITRKYIRESNPRSFLLDDERTRKLVDALPELTKAAITIPDIDEPDCWGVGHDFIGPR